MQGYRALKEDIFGKRSGGRGRKVKMMFSEGHPPTRLRDSGPGKGTNPQKARRPFSQTTLLTQSGKRDANRNIEEDIHQGRERPSSDDTEPISHSPSPMRNGYPPTHVGWEEEEKLQNMDPHLKLLYKQCDRQNETQTGILQLLYTNQEAALCKDKGGFRFAGGKDENFQALLSVYNEKTASPHMDDARRLNILGTLLEGPAETMYKDQLHLQNKEVALRTVWESLRQAYERDTNYMSKIFLYSVEPQVPNTLDGLKRLQENLLKCWGMVPEDSKEHLNTDTSLQGFVRRLPSSFQQEYRSLILDAELKTKKRPPFKHLMDFVGAAIRVTELDETGWLQHENISINKKKKDNITSYTKKDNKNNYETRKKEETYDTRRTFRQDDNISNDKKEVTCGYCKTRGHFMWKCNQYLHLTLKERADFIEKERRCITCLSKHEGSKCLSVYKCFACDIKHNSTLCPKNGRNTTARRVHVNAYEQFQSAEEGEDNLEVSIHPSRGQNK
jgi:hypothetical protein